ncbi:protein FAM192A-like [Sinocyclocheilus rhinocerous]|uniref:protein FAM192A-like n=1 Tax=Sinocyclocheilus rhinocerous TaxID=307959 RepID=UPI0007B90219|nr:PREDICTED: protein FAM192A-like [Sinocyclocheilus rhinocerous]
MCCVGSAMADGVDLSRKFVSESELDEIRKKRQEEWEKVRKPDDPEEAPEEEYDPRSLYERLQEQKDKKQEEYEEQFKFKNMVKGLDEDETSFLDEVSRQQSLIEKHRRDEEAQEIKEYRISFYTLKRTQYYYQEAVEPKSPGAGVTRSGILHLPSAAVCVGILPGLGAYSGSSDSESSSDSEGLGAAPSPSQRCTT